MPRNFINLSFTDTLILQFPFGTMEMNCFCGGTSTKVTSPKKGQGTNNLGAECLNSFNNVFMYLFFIDVAAFIVKHQSIFSIFTRCRYSDANSIENSNETFKINNRHICSLTFSKCIISPARFLKVS